MIEVKLIGMTSDPLQALYMPARMCQTALSVERLCDSVKAESPDKMETFIKRVIDSGHTSILEFVDFTFAISGVSRVMTHQLVRHRMNSYGQRSQKFVKEQGNQFYTPQDIQDNEKALEVYNKLVERCFKTAYKLRELGISEDSVRMVYPNCTTSQLMMKTNLRELIHMSNERLCTNASPEIREVFKQIKSLVTQEVKMFGEYLVPKCKRLGYCPEKFKSCGVTGVTKEAKE